jgi:hypothetical protein
MSPKRPLQKLLRKFAWMVAVLLLLLAGPLSVIAFGELDLKTHWSEASHASAQLAPRPAEAEEAIVQVYAARAYNWRGAFGVHTWIATKRRAANHYRVYQVIGWNLYRGHSVVSIGSRSAPDSRWYNAMPELLVEHRGSAAEVMIPQIENAVDSYPYPYNYKVWPGPNSNTFIAYVARQVPALGVDLPPTAIGKDYLPSGEWFSPVPSGSGWQVSLFGLLGVSLAREEGVEFNLLGLSFGFDLNDLALRLPGIGRLEI